MLRNITIIGNILTGIMSVFNTLKGYIRYTYYSFSSLCLTMLRLSKGFFIHNRIIFFDKNFDFIKQYSIFATVRTFTKVLYSE